MYIWGTECFGEFTIPHLVKSVKGRCKEVNLGKNFGTILTDNGDIYVWGHNNAGQLGMGDFQDRPTPMKVPSLKHKTVSTLS